MLKSVEKLNHILINILNLVYVNFLWLLFSIVGLGLFGIGPSTYALVSICRQWIRGNRSQPVFSTYLMYFKEGFKSSLLISWIYLLGGIILVVDLLYVANWYVRVALFAVSFIYLISLTFIFPIMAHYNWKGIFYKIKISILMGIACLQYSLVLFVVIVIIYWAMISFLPGILLFFGTSLLFYMITWTANQVFMRMEALNTEGLEDKKIYQIAKE